MAVVSVTRTAWDELQQRRCFHVTNFIRARTQLRLNRKKQLAILFHLAIRAYTSNDLVADAGK